MAIEVTNIYLRHRELFDEQMARFIAEKPMQADLKTMKMCPTAEGSGKINDLPGRCLILATPACAAPARILHHLKANPWKPGTHVLIVGYG